MKAVIIAGGSGTRLRPLTCNMPKPMVPIANKPVMEHIIELLKNYHITDIMVTLQYMPRIIRDYFGDGHDFNVRIKYFTERVPLGTAGSVKNAEKHLDETFIVMSGDALTDINIQEVIDFHISKQAIATLVLKRVEFPTEYGVVVTNEKSQVERFLEKPSWGEVLSDTVNTGIYVLSKEVLSYYKKGQTFDFSKDLFPILLKEKRPIFGYETKDYWCDIGDLRAYIQANMDVLEEKVKVNIPGKKISDKVWISSGTDIAQDISISAPCIIGKDVKIKKNVNINSHTIIGDRTTIFDRVNIKRAILWRDCNIGNSVQLRGCVACDKARIKRNVEVLENSIIGANTVIFEDAIVNPDVKIWPNKVIDEGITVTSNVIWGGKISRIIFGNRGITGELNNDLTIEYLSKLASSYYSVFTKDSKIAISRDHSSISNVTKLCMEAGLLACGAKVVDLGELLMPVFRTAIRFYDLDGGIYICSDLERDKNQIHIDFINSGGANIDRATERKIENILTIEDFRRAKNINLNKTEYIGGYSDFYIRSILNSIDLKPLGYKVMFIGDSKEQNQVAINILKGLGCDVTSIENDISFDAIDKEAAITKRMLEEHYHIGVYMQKDCEKMILVDEKGRSISEEKFSALVSLILLKKTKGNVLIAPISATSTMEKLAKENNGKIVRSRTSIKDLMNTILKTGKREHALEQFSMHFDAMSGLAKILEFMKMGNYTLSQLLEMVPEFYVHKTKVRCPWIAKGRVIREILESDFKDDTEVIEGVKVHKENGWVLVLPDAQRPSCSVISEGCSVEAAQELTDIYVNKIINITKSY